MPTARCCETESRERLGDSARGKILDAPPVLMR